MLQTRFWLTNAIALLGVGCFFIAGLPLPWLFGPIFSCLIAALLGMKLTAYKPLSDSMRTILGVAVGATVTVSFFTSIPLMLPTLILVLILTILIGVIGVIYFKTLRGYDFATAYYGSMPGGLQDMLVFGEEAGANVRALSLIHATRVLVIVILLPFILTHIWQVDLAKPPGDPINGFQNTQLFLLLFSAIVGWQLAKKIGMFGASILGPLLLAAALTLLGALTTRPPSEAIWAAQYFIAIGIGTKYVGITMTEVKRDILSALGFCVILLLLTTMAILLVMAFDLAPPIETILSLTPGGQAELVVLAIIVGADMTFVVAHHLLRIFFVILGAPIIARLVPKSLRY